MKYIRVFFLTLIVVSATAFFHDDDGTRLQGALSNAAHAETQGPEVNLKDEARGWFKSNISNMHKRAIIRSLISPYNFNRRFDDSWKFENDFTFTDKDIIFNLYDAKTAKRMFVWLTKRDDKIQVMGVSRSFNIVCIAENQTGLNEQQEKVAVKVISLINKNDTGSFNLKRSENNKTLSHSVSLGGMDRSAKAAKQIINRIVPISIGTIILIFMIFLYRKFFPYRPSFAAVKNQKAGLNGNSHEPLKFERFWRINVPFCLLLILVLAAYLRFSGLLDTKVVQLHHEEARIALGAATVLEKHTLIINYDSDYEPPLSVYFPIPFIALFGRAPYVVKLASVVFSLLAVFMTYLFGREYFSKRVGLVAALFIAVLPFAVKYGRIGHEHCFLPLFTASVLFMYARFIKTGKALPLYAGAFIMGLGISTKIIYLYFIFLIVISCVISGEYKKLRLSPKRLFVAALSFLVGAIPFIAVIIMSDAFVQSIRPSTDTITAKEILQAFAERLQMADWSFTSLFWYSISAWIVVWFVKRKIDSRALFLMIFSVAGIMLTVLKISYGMQDYQLLYLLPVPLVLIAGLFDVNVGLPRFINTSAALVFAVALVATLPNAGFPDDIVPKEFMVEKPMIRYFEHARREETISNRREDAIIHSYIEFMKTGALPPNRHGSVTSLSCNRFRQCNGFRPFETINAFFGDMINGDGASESGDCLTGNHFDDKCTALLKKAIRELIFQHNIRNFIFLVQLGDEDNLSNEDKETRFAKDAIDIIKKLGAEGAFDVKTRIIAPIDGSSNYYDNYNKNTYILTVSNVHADPKSTRSRRTESQ